MSDNTTTAATTPPSGEEPRKKGLSRRSVLKWTGIGVGALAVAGGGTAVGIEQSLKASGSDQAGVEKKHIVIAGGSIGGLTVAAQLKKAVPQANVTLIEPNDTHYYQPGFTLIGADVYKPDDVVMQQASLIPAGVKWVKDRVSAFDPEHNNVRLENGETIPYDYLVIAVGVVPNWKSVEGIEAALQTDHVSNVYDWKLAQKWRDLRNAFTGGEALIHYPQGYVKCGGAPQKQVWLAEDYWRTQKKNRDQVDLHYFTPQKSMFPIIPRIDEIVTPMSAERGINAHFFHVLKAIDPSTRTAIFEETLPDKSTREVRQHYDLFHAMPNFTVPKPLQGSVLTTEKLKGQVEVDKYTLQSPKFPNVFSLGDAAGTGAGKTAATIRKQAPTVVGNIIDLANGREISHKYSGIGGCPLLTRYGKCMMIEFDYDANLVNEKFYDSLNESDLWWQFKVHGLKRVYRVVMIRGYQAPF